MAAHPSSRTRPRHRMVDRVAAILEAVARADGLSLTEIARRLDAPVSSVQGLVNGLVVTGYLDECDRTYRLGVAPYFLNLLAGRGAVNRIDHDDLVALHTETEDATVVLAVPVGDDAVYLDHCSTDPRTAFLAEGFQRRPLIRTSVGWAMLAHREARDLWAYLGGLGSADRERVDALLGSLEGIRSSGVVVLPGAAEGGLDGIAVPLRDRGRVVASVGVVASPDWLAPRAEPITATLLAHAARWHARD